LAKTIEELGKVLGIEVPDAGALEINGLAYNSKEIKAGDAFFCIPGEKFDGNKFISDAIKAGALLIVSEKDKPEDLDKNFNGAYFKVECVRTAMGQLASHFFDYPSTKLRLLGVTGTNGKTTTTHVIEHVLNASGFKTALIGTMGVRWPGKADFVDTHHTTPQSIDLQKLLAQMVKDGVTHAAMEVSSHAIFLKRVEGCQFASASLTNLTQDHLDFHKTMDQYRYAKLGLWDLLSLSNAKDKTSVINKDDPSVIYFTQATPESATLFTFGFKESDFQVLSAKYSGTGTEIVLKTPESKDEVKLTLPLLGEFNVYNTLTAMAVCFGEGVSVSQFQKALSTFESVPGRFQLVALGENESKNDKNSPICIVDYAHTPDGLEKILKAARPMVEDGKKLFVVFGCGGDRDPMKRPKMAEVAASLADQLIVTSDNPRSEDPDKIIEDILAGIDQSKKEKVTVEACRRTAIYQTIAQAQAQDMVVVAGKGHETYQILKDRTIDFNDAEEIKIALKKRL